MDGSTGGLIHLTGRFPVRTPGRQVRASSFSDIVLDVVCLVSYFLIAATLVVVVMFWRLSFPLARAVCRSCVSAWICRLLSWSVAVAWTVSWINLQHFSLLDSWQSKSWTCRVWLFHLSLMACWNVSLNVSFGNLIYCFCCVVLSFIIYVLSWLFYFACFGCRWTSTWKSEGGLTFLYQRLVWSFSPTPFFLVCPWFLAGAVGAGTLPLFAQHCLPARNAPSAHISLHIFRLRANYIRVFNVRLVLFSLSFLWQRGGGPWFSIGTDLSAQCASWAASNLTHLLT